MSAHNTALLRRVALASVGGFLVLSIVYGQPLAKAEPPSSAPSIELRLNHFSPSYRLSTDLPGDADEYQDSSLHFVFGGGVRVFPSGSGHGVLAEAEVRLDPDLDSVFDEYIHAPAHVAVAHIGYAHRFVRPFRQRYRFALATTLHASVALGVMDQRSFGEPRVGLVGVRLGLDLDLHARRFFFGWTLQAEVLQHFDRNTTLFLTHNFLPFMRVGFMFGRQVQEPYPSERPRELFDLRARAADEASSR